MVTNRSDTDLSQVKAEIDTIIAQAGLDMTAQVQNAIRQGEVDLRDIAEQVALEMAEQVLKQILANIPNTGVEPTSGQSGVIATLATQLVQRGARFL